MIIAFDPSGNFIEGKGTTGICDMDNEGNIIAVRELSAKDYDCPMAYWDAHIEYLMDAYTHVFKTTEQLEVVIEGFRLYDHKKSTQVNSLFETPKLIGLIEHWCWLQNIPLKIQFATEVKTRWKDSVLVSTGIITRDPKHPRRYWNGQVLNNHKVDAIRHACHYFRYKRGKSSVDQDRKEKGHS